jgi:Zn-dependent protease
MDRPRARAVLSRVQINLLLAFFNLIPCRRSTAAT